MSVCFINTRHILPRLFILQSSRHDYRLYGLVLGIRNVHSFVFASWWMDIEPVMNLLYIFCYFFPSVLFILFISTERIRDWVIKHSEWLHKVICSKKLGEKKKKDIVLAASKNKTKHTTKKPPKAINDISANCKNNERENPEKVALLKVIFLFALKMLQEHNVEAFSLLC